MTFPKTLAAVCGLAVGTATVMIAQDTDAQQKALEALRQFTAEKEGRTSQRLTTQPTRGNTRDDDAIQRELEEKARQAVRQPQQQTQPQQVTPQQAAPQQAPPQQAAPQARPQTRSAPPVATTTTAAPPANETEQERRARQALDDLRRATPSPAGGATTVVVTETATDDREAALRRALEARYSAAPADNTIAPTLEQQARQQLDALTTQPPAAVAGRASPQPQQQAMMQQSKPTTRQEKLDALLEQYMDNTITPREYHEQRATIIAGN